MDDMRYSFEQISRATGINVYSLEIWRGYKGIVWHPKGYTLAEVRKMISSCGLVDPEVIAKTRSKKAKELYRLLSEE